MDERLGREGETTPGVAGLVEHCFRREHARILSALVRRLGAERLHLAEEAVQEALLSALRTWPVAGIPVEPGAWLQTAARNHALDAIRRDAALRERLADLPARPAGEREGEDLDDQLAMMFMCCHPALGPSEQVALTLRCVAGFSTAEIARAFFAQEATIAQRIVRAKRRVAASRVPMAMPPPDDLPARLDAVLEVLYLLFNEGYTPRDHLWHAARADCLWKLGRAEEARTAYDLALGSAPTEPERVYLRRRIERTRP